MFSDHFQQMMFIFSAGLGLCLIGGANALLRNRALALRFAVSLVLVTVTAGITIAVCGETAIGLRVGAVIAVAYSLVAVAGSPWMANACVAVLSAMKNSSLRWGGLALVGFGVAIASVTVSESQNALEVDRQMAELEILTSPPDTKVPAIRATTDRGREIAIREAKAPRDRADMDTVELAILNNKEVRDSVMRSEPASDRSNCHGWVFTGGRFWVSGSDVDQILADNLYASVSEPRPGDLVVYRSGTDVIHTSIVRYVSEGQPVLVEGKWGCTGVYLHAVDKSIYAGTFSYYRSNRTGHELAGLNSSVPQQPQGSPQPVPNPAVPDEFTE